MHILMPHIAFVKEEVDIVKDKSKVSELIAQLKAEIETPYELAAVERLEIELLNGAPKVEVIDENHQKFLGLTFRKHKCNGGHYYYTLSLHQAIWFYHFGATFEGYDIHHDDLDNNHNEITNLRLMTKAEHTKLHNNLRKTKTKCTNCGAEIEIVETNNTKSGNHFCKNGNKCYEEWRRKMKLRKEIRKCQLCGKEFETNKYSGCQHCHSCRAKIMWKKRRNQ